MITLIYAQDRQGGIGKDNKMLWHLPNDLQFFKKTTMGHSILMGRKTFESLNKRLLPGRQSIVLTRDTTYGQEIEGLKVMNSLEEALKYAEKEPLMIIGGAQIYKEFLPYADEIICTQIDETFDADTFMPPIDETKWQLVRIEPGKVDPKNHYAHQFEWWKRR